MSGTEFGDHQSLRIGICQCSTYYLGQFEGKTLSINWPEHPSDERLKFVCQEIPLSIINHRRSLLDNRCHFSIDYHRFVKECLVELRRNDLIANGPGRGWKLYIGGLSSNDERFSSWEWRQTRPPKADQIIDKIKQLLTNMRPNRLIPWLTTMTPPDWSLPTNLPGFTDLIPIRLGVCQRTTCYHGSLSNYQLLIRRLDYMVFAKPLTVVLETVPINQDDQYHDLKNKRPNFLVGIDDIHRGHSTNVLLKTVHFVDRQGGQESMFVGSGPFRRHQMTWRARRPPSPAIVGEAIRSIIENFTPNQFFQWLINRRPTH